MPTVNCLLERKDTNMVKRKKVDAEPVLKTWGEVEEALKEIKKIDNDVVRIEARFNDRIDAITNSMAGKTEEPLKRKARLEKDLEEFARANKDEVRSEKRLKTKELNHGFIGFRWTPWKIVTVNKKKAEDVIKLLKKKEFFSWISTRESINKTAVMKDFDEEVTDKEEMSSVGLKRDHKEEFWYDTDKTRAISAEADVTKLKDVA